MSRHAKVERAAGGRDASASRSRSDGDGWHGHVFVAMSGHAKIERAALDAIKATIRGGKLELQAPPDWPDGTEVLIEPTGAPAERIGLDESEWRDDPEALADWAAWLRTIEPLDFTPEETARIAEFAERMRRYNIEAVRRQMEQGGDEG